MNESISAERIKYRLFWKPEVEKVEESESHKENVKYPIAATAIFQPILPREEVVTPSLHVTRQSEPHPITTIMAKQRATTRVITLNRTLINAMAVE